MNPKTGKKTGKSRFPVFVSPEAQAAYDRLLAEYLANGRQVAPKPKAERQETSPPIPQPEAVPANPPPDIAPVSAEMTVAEVCVLFMEHANTYYKLSDGRLSSSYDCERRSKSAARGGVGRPVEKCSAQPCSGVGQENRGGAAIFPYRERGTRSVCSDGDVD
jgi:hypothetical protein